MSSENLDPRLDAPVEDGRYSNLSADSYKTISEDSDTLMDGENEETDDGEIKMGKRSHKTTKIRAFFNFFRGMVGCGFLTLPHLCQEVD